MRQSKTYSHFTMNYICVSISFVHHACRLPPFLDTRIPCISRTLLSSPRLKPIASRAFSICACVVKSMAETVAIEVVLAGRTSSRGHAFRPYGWFRLRLDSYLFWPTMLAILTFTPLGAMHRTCHSHTLAFCVYHSTLHTSGRTSTYLNRITLFRRPCAYI